MISIRPLFGLGVLLAATTMAKADLSFWDQSRKGGNCFNQTVDAAYFAAARELGLDYIRLVPDKWATEHRDFLVGDCDNYTGLVPADLAQVIEVLDLAHAHDQRVIFGMLSLPGNRWRQHNEMQSDYRLWQDQSYRDQALAFWRDLATALQNHPAILAFNPLNEPHPELGDGIEDYSGTEFTDWLTRHRGTLRDLDRFNREVIAAIRSAAPKTPILIEGYNHGSAKGLAALKPVKDPQVLYSFHFYEPWNYTASRANGGKYTYPDAMPDWWNSPPSTWTINNLRERMQPVADWAAAHRVPSSRVVVAEFGCERLVAGATTYLTDVVSLLNEFGWHWAFYSFREDAWQAMDYELGTHPKNGAYWSAVDKGNVTQLYDSESDLWQIFVREFANE
ncbi:glycoside hydrolase family 5 protein [Opitutaceae bacterium]|nr:glycoside hydrolase family 5 protein [Opitutaceae bacterium]MDB4474082.1 glycoside hydrolase family 5 protein [Opitutaceae bacterium]